MYGRRSPIVLVVLGEQRLFDEQQPQGLERSGELLRQWTVYPAVEVETDVHALRLCRLHALDHVVKQLGVPIHSSSAVAFILTASKPCFLRCSAASPISCAVAADPGVGTDLVAHLAAQHLPCRQAEHAALEIPQRLFEPGERRHDDRSATVEAAAVTDLPDILDPKRVRADEPVAVRLEHPVHRLGPAFEAPLRPIRRRHPPFQPERTTTAAAQRRSRFCRSSTSSCLCLLACAPMANRPAASPSSSSG